MDLVRHPFLPIDAFCLLAISVFSRFARFNCLCLNHSTGVSVFNGGELCFYLDMV